MEFRDTGTTTKVEGDGTQKLLSTKGYKGSAAVTTLTTLLMKGYLRRGDGMFSFAACRRTERLFGDSGKGRSKALKFEGTAVMIGPQYDPQQDTCLAAFMRLLAARAEFAKAKSDGA